MWIWFLVPFSSSHNGETTANILFDLLAQWNLLDKVWAVLADNASDMCAAMKKLSEIWNTHKNAYRLVKESHIWFITHVVTLTVKDCLTFIHNQVDQIRILLAAVRCSVKRRNFFEKIQKHLGIQLLCWAWTLLQGGPQHTTWLRLWTNPGIFSIQY